MMTKAKPQKQAGKTAPPARNTKASPEGDDVYELLLAELEARRVRLRAAAPDGVGRSGAFARPAVPPSPASSAAVPASSVPRSRPKTGIDASTIFHDFNTRHVFRLSRRWFPFPPPAFFVVCQKNLRVS